MAKDLSASNLRVLMITQWFDPEPTFKGLTFALALKKLGLDVHVWTGFPNYPGGKLYPGYRISWRQRELVEGISVTRLPLYPSHDGSAIKRVLNYLSFAASVLVQGLFCRHKPAVIYVYQPPLTVGLAAAVVGLVRRIPIVLDIQDMWPDTLRATGMIRSERLLGFVGTACLWLYGRAARIAVLSPGFKRLLVDRGVPAAKVEVIPNWCEEEALEKPSGQLAAAFPGSERFRILFAGNMGRAQALDTVLEAAELVQKTVPYALFVFMGGGLERDRLVAQGASMALTNVCFLPSVPMTEVGHALKAADVLLVHLRNDPLFEITIPSKTQAYMSVGRPVLMGVKGDAAQLVESAGCGLQVVPEDAKSLAEAVERLAHMTPTERQEMGAAGHRYYRQHLSLATGAGQFATIFRQVART